MTNPFVLEATRYKRDINVLGHYVNDQAKHLEVMTGKPYEVCRAFVQSKLKPGAEFAFKDPAVMYLERQDNGDRIEVVTTLSEYLQTAVRERELIAPTFTTYINPRRKESILLAYIDSNVKKRSVAKKAMFAAKIAGNKFLETIKDTEQTNAKLGNNAVSGGHVSASTPIVNKTAHSTLTSNCRSTSGYGNANNEKFLCGNRHYWSPDIVINNIISIINHSDYVAIELAMEKFELVHPTVQQTMDCILYSTKLYWRSQEEVDRIERLVQRLKPIERSAFVYTGDMFHLMKCNEAFFRSFIAKLMKRVENPDGIIVKKADLTKVPDDVKVLATMLWPDTMRGKSLSAEKGTKEAVIGTSVYDNVAGTAANILDVLDTYRELVTAFWVTNNVPASMAYFPESIRRAVLTSDTDSTIFTVQDWVQWYCGKMSFDVEGSGVAAAMIFLASQSIIHILAKMSANFGIDEKRIFQIAMKNEFKFDVFVPTQVGKHYFAMITAREGNLYEEFESEIKGVHLKSSNSSKVVMARAKEMMEEMMNTIMAGKKISAMALLKEVADLERQIIASIARGESAVFKRNQIKTADGYKEKEASAGYMQYLLWEEVFAPKYGHVQKPPYTVIKISTDIDTPTRMQDWVLGWEDKALSKRMIDWMNKNYKQTIKTFMVPEQCIATNGIPKEIMDVIGVRSIVKDITNVFYIILECIGIFIHGDKIGSLASDFY